MDVGLSGVSTKRWRQAHEGFLQGKAIVAIEREFGLREKNCRGRHLRKPNGESLFRDRVARSVKRQRPGTPMGLDSLPAARKLRDFERVAERGRGQYE